MEFFQFPSESPLFENAGHLDESPAQHYDPPARTHQSGYYHTADSDPQGHADGSAYLAGQDTAYARSEGSTAGSSPEPGQIPDQRENNDTQYTDESELSIQFNYRAVPELIRSANLNNEQKMSILFQCSHDVLNRLYRQHKVKPPRPVLPAANRLLSKVSGTNESNYRPLSTTSEPSLDPNAPSPLYPPFSGHFKGAEDARAYRKRTRIAPKAHAPDVERVKLYGRHYWVRRIYDAMIDISDIADGDSSIHRQRFTTAMGFDALELEATAHHIFDAAIAVHERGWNRPKVYHKKVVRGKLTDVSEKSLETRLARICLCLKQKKATVDDAVRGGVTLALLCDNPEARGFTKMSNNTGNKKRGERLRFAKETDRKVKQQEQEQERQDEEQPRDDDDE